MNWSTILGVILVALILVSLIGFVWALRDWLSFGQTVNDFAVKIGSFGIKLFAVVVSVVSASPVGADKDNWYFPTIAGAVCALAWELLDKTVERRVKSVEKLDKQALVDAKQALSDAESECERALADAQEECESLVELLAVLRRSVTEKTIRLIAKMSERREKPSVVLIRSALTPRNHLDELLQAIAAFASAQVPKERKEIYNFRVGLYVDHGGVMRPLRAVNLNDRSYDVFRSYATNEASFRLAAGESESHVVACANHRKSIIVEDCVAAEAEGKFHFFNDNQRSYLRSMLAYSLGQVCCDNGSMAAAVLAIDTDLAGHFREADRDSLEFWLREFGARIKLELLLHAMLLTRGAVQ